MRKAAMDFVQCDAITLDLFRLGWIGLGLYRAELYEPGFETRNLKKIAAQFTMKWPSFNPN